jgi:ABC-type multidrug transport system ATPase subunit
MMNNTDAATADAVVIDGLQVRRGRHDVFDGLSLRIPRGQVIGLLGPSGCGKTTLMRAIVGVQRTHGGTVDVFGEPAGSRSLRRRVAYGTQGSAVYTDVTVRENLRYFASVLGAPRSDVDRVLTQVREAGAGASEPEDKAWGDRTAIVTDPDGYRWVLATFRKLAPFS